MKHKLIQLIAVMLIATFTFQSLASGQTRLSSTVGQAKGEGVSTGVDNDPTPLSPGLRHKDWRISLRLKKTVPSSQLLVPSFKLATRNWELGTNLRPLASEEKQSAGSRLKIFDHIYEDVLRGHGKSGIGFTRLRGKTGIDKGRLQRCLDDFVITGLAEMRRVGNNLLYYPALEDKKSALRLKKGLAKLGKGAAVKEMRKARNEALRTPRGRSTHEELMRLFNRYGYADMWDKLPPDVRKTIGDPAGLEWAKESFLIILSRSNPDRFIKDAAGALYKSRRLGEFEFLYGVCDRNMIFGNLPPQFGGLRAASDKILAEKKKIDAFVRQHGLSQPKKDYPREAELMEFLYRDTCKEGRFIEIMEDIAVGPEPKEGPPTITAYEQAVNRLKALITMRLSKPQMDALCKIMIKLNDDSQNSRLLAMFYGDGAGEAFMKFLDVKLRYGAPIPRGTATFTRRNRRQGAETSILRPVAMADRKKLAAIPVSVKMMHALQKNGYANGFTVITLQRVWRNEYRTNLPVQEAYRLMEDALNKKWIREREKGTGQFIFTQEWDRWVLSEEEPTIDVEAAGATADEALRSYLSVIVRPGMDVADIGAARGQRAIVSASSGAAVDAIEIHKGTLREAIERFNRQPPEVSRRIHPVLSDLFSNPILEGKLYDVIVFAPPRVNEKTPAHEGDWRRIVEDPEFRLLGRFLNDARLHLKEGGRLIVAYGDEDEVDEIDGHIYVGGMQTLGRLAGNNWDVLRVVSNPHAMFGIYVLSLIKGKELLPPQESMDFIGRGADSTVYRSGNRIFKFYNDLSLDLIERYKKATDAVGDLLGRQTDELFLGGEKYKVSYLVVPISAVFKEGNGQVVAESGFAVGMRFSLLFGYGESEFTEALEKMDTGKHAAIRQIRANKAEDYQAIKSLLNLKTKMATDRLGLQGISLSGVDNVMIDVSPDAEEVRFIITDICPSIGYLRTGPEKPIDLLERQI